MTRSSTTELRVYLPIAGLRRQFAAYLGTPTRARGYPAAEGDHALIVEVAGSGDRLVAFDVLGTGQGERVLVAQGSVAAGWLPGRPPVDALIIGSIDEPSPDAGQPGPGPGKSTAGKSKQEPGPARASR